MSRLSLRARLVLGVIVLAAAGLAAANVATYTSLHSFLIDRTDQALQESRRGYDHLDHGDCEDRKGGPGGPSRGGNAGDFIQVRTGNGDVACTSQQSGFDTTSSPPRLPAVVAAPDGPRYFTVSSEDGTSRYRVRASNEPHSGATVIIATSLADVDATLRRLLLIELLVTGAVVAGLAALGLWVVRLGLRPLDAIGKTAEAIAAGDLTRRVEQAESPPTSARRWGGSGWH